jgi:hypothetical protein
VSVAYFFSPASPILKCGGMRSGEFVIEKKIVVGMPKILVGQVRGPGREMALVCDSRSDHSLLPQNAT